MEISALGLMAFLIRQNATSLFSAGGTDMEWHLNDLSLREQVNSSKELQTLIQEILTLRLRRSDIGKLIYCSRKLLSTTLMGHMTVRQVIESTGDKNFINSSLRWFANSGPFWDDTRQGDDDDLFYWGAEEVQETGLGEAARRRLVATDARAFSFVGAESQFNVAVLTIVHGLLDQPIDFVEVPNARSIEDLEQLPAPALGNWRDVVEAAKVRNPNLSIADHVIEDLQPRPFNTAVATKLLDLLTILDALSLETDGDGKFTLKGQQLYQKFFVGKEAPFSSEDPDDTAIFNFSDPQSGKKIYCPWHGKINIGDPFRFHYEWPRPKGQAKVKLLYMGQKLTKA